MIDSKLQEQLREKFNPDGSDLRKIQLHMLEMLKYVDKVCRENNIRYWLSSGTCLGAVRHGGFIPWDDDCDIEVLGEDFEKLVELLSTDRESKYYLQSRDTDPNYDYRYPKLRDESLQISEVHGFDKQYAYHGVFIDIFPMRKSNSLFIHRLGLLVYLFETKIKSRNKLIKKSIKKTSQYLYKVLTILSSIHANGRVRHEIGMGFPRPRYLSEILPVKYVSFEDFLAPIPINAEAYLKKIYGDYEKLPDIKDIAPHITKVTGL